MDEFNLVSQWLWQSWLMCDAWLGKRVRGIQRNHCPHSNAHLVELKAWRSKGRSSIIAGIRDEETKDSIKTPHSTRPRQYYSKRIYIDLIRHDRASRRDVLLTNQRVTLQETLSGWPPAACINAAQNDHNSQANILVRTASCTHLKNHVHDASFSLSTTAHPIGVVWNSLSSIAATIPFVLYFKKSSIYVNGFSHFLKSS